MQATMIQRGLFEECKPCERLTPEQQALVVKYRPYTLKLANKWHSCYGGNQCDWQSEALLGLCIAALRFDSTRMSKWNLGTAAFVSCVWHQVRSKLNEFRRSRHHGGMRHVPRNKDVQRDEWKLPDDGAKDQRLESIEKQEAASVAMSFLDGTERRIMVERIDQGKTLEGVGRRLGLSKERVRQIQDRAIGKMRTALVSRGVQYV